MAETVVTVVLEIAKCLVPWARSEISHLRKYKTNFQNLKEEVEKLKGVSSSIQHKVDEAKRNGEEIEENVQRWLERANKIIQEEAVKFTKDEETAAKKRCFKGLCPDLKTRYQLGKESVKQRADVVKHREAGSFDTLSYRTSPKDPRLSNKNYMAFESRESTLNDILRAISNPDFNIIGICGMGGVGKTTLAKEVAKKAEGNKLFDRVVFAEVNPSPEIEKIQGEIADRLSLSLANRESRSGRAGKLCERLKMEKNILVILDNIWEWLDLQDVGIPLGDDHKGCKVLLTARSVEVLSGQMDSQQIFELRILNEKEAWNLFKRTTGNYIEGCEFLPIATEVAKKCAGLPIALVTVAKTLRNGKLFEWQDFRRQLGESSSENIKGIHAIMELSYNRLEGVELQKTFLLIGYSFVKSIKILLMYGMGLGLFKGINTMEEAQARVRTLVQKLKDSSLLLDSSIFGEDFSMHDIVRDVAISIASKKHQVFTMKNVSNVQWPDENILKSCSSVVLYNIQSCSEFPQVLECQQLKFFRAHCHSFEFRNDFFARMIELRVLDLRSGSWPPWSLPSSIGLLENLQAVRLGNWIDGLAVIGYLRKLEILHLSYYSFLPLPVEIGKLTRLRSLDLRGCHCIEAIPPNIISSLSHLEELYLGAFANWEVEGVNNERRNASLDELNHLSYLTALQIVVQDANILPRDLSFLKKLVWYEIKVGFWGRILFEGQDDDSSAEISRIFKFRSHIEADISFDVWHIMELKKIEVLSSDGLLDRKNFLYGLDNEGFSQLKSLKIKNNRNLSRIVECSNNNNSAMIEFGHLRSLTLGSLPQLTSFYSISINDTHSTLFKEKVSLPTLQKLRLDRINVERIWQNQVVALSCGIQNLTHLVISNCSNLRQIFSSSMASSCHQLKELEIRECPLIKEIVFLDDGLREEERKNAMFSQLEVLIIEDLRNLTKFFSSEDHIKFSSLKRLQIRICPKLKEFIVKNDLAENPAPFFNEKVAFPSLEEIVIFDMDNLKLLVQPQLAHQILFRKLKSMTVHSCDNLKSLTLCGVDSQLESLDISGCGEEEIVFVGKEGTEQTNSIIVFPTVISLTLHDLPNFKTLFPISKVFPNLEELFVKGKNIGTMIRQFSEDFLCKLKCVNVDLDGATTVSSLDFLVRFLNMNRLIIDGRSCGPLKPSMFKSTAVINYLNECSDLKHILKKEFNMDNVVDLIVNNCVNSINIGPSLRSFQNLTLLTVWYCDGLENIVTFSAAKSLVRLREMEIYSCEKIIEIVADERDATKDGIIFRELKKLSLMWLESLSTFCSGNYTIKFPALEELIVEDCPKMMIFCEGELSTPNLHQVKLYPRDEDGCWNGDLNTTIQRLHEKKEVQSCEEDLGQPST